MYVKKVEVISGPSLIKKYWTLYDDNDKEIGSISEGFMCELGHLCSGEFITRKWGSSTEIHHCMWDAVTKGLGITGTMEEVDAVCELFFKEGFHLAM